MENAKILTSAKPIMAIAIQELRVKTSLVVENAESALRAWAYILIAVLILMSAQMVCVTLRWIVKI